MLDSCCQKKHTTQERPVIYSLFLGFGALVNFYDRRSDAPVTCIEESRPKWKCCWLFTQFHPNTCTSKMWLLSNGISERKRRERSLICSFFFLCLQFRSPPSRSLSMAGRRRVKRMREIRDMEWRMREIRDMERRKRDRIRIRSMKTNYNRSNGPRKSRVIYYEMAWRSEPITYWASRLGSSRRCAIK